MKSYTVSPVSVQLIHAANQAIVEKCGRGDIAITLTVALASKYTAEEVLAVTYRLHAMQKIVLAGKSLAWTRAVKDQPYQMVNDAMFRAAARTPLKYTSQQSIEDISFDEQEFLKNALEESDIEGKA